jgi:titin
VGITLNGYGDVRLTDTTITQNTVVANLGAGIVVHYGATMATISANLISGNGREGIFVAGDSNHVTIQNNKIGTTADGMAALPNGLDGIVITDGGHDNLVGGTTTAARNLISGNRGNGVWIVGGETMNNVVDGNYIGLNGAGTAPIPNLQAGVVVSNTLSTAIGSASATTAR